MILISSSYRLESKDEVQLLITAWVTVQKHKMGRKEEETVVTWAGSWLLQQKASGLTWSKYDDFEAKYEHIISDFNLIFCCGKML